MNRRKGIIAGLAALMAGLTRSYAQETNSSSENGWWTTKAPRGSFIVDTKPPNFLLMLDRYEDDAKVLVIQHKGERIELTCKEIMEALRP